MLGPVLDVANWIWSQVQEGDAYASAIDQCEEQGSSGSGFSWCCVITKVGVQGCFTGSITWLKMTGRVVRSPCNLVIAQEQLAGFLRPNNNEIHINEHVSW